MVLLYFRLSLVCIPISGQPVFVAAIGGSASSRPAMATGFEDIVVGVAGTGNMGQAHAYRWSKEGLKVVVGSRHVRRQRKF